MGKCGDQLLKCIICACLHKIEDYQCGVNGCSKDIRRMYTHVLTLFANCGRNHLANLTRCTLRYKAEVNARKQKTAKKTLERGKAMINNSLEVEVEDEVTNPNLDPRMDMEIDYWAQSLGPESSSQDYSESKDHTQDY